MIRGGRKNQAASKASLSKMAISNSDRPEMYKTEKRGEPIMTARD